MIRLKVSGWTLLKFKNVGYNSVRSKIDRSKVPELMESDLKEKFVKSSGPGGQKVNKNNSCVYLVHEPTGLSVKVSDKRFQYQNRKIARERLSKKLDVLINGEDSVENQLKKLEKERSIKRANKQKRLNELKEKWRNSFADKK